MKKYTKELTIFEQKQCALNILVYVAEFCEKNNEKSIDFMTKMFAGISEEQLQVTIRTIMQIEDNLKEI